MKDNITVDISTGTAVFRLIGELGSSTRQSYDGTFTVKTVIDPQKQLAAGRIQRSLLGPFGEKATDHEANMAFALSQLQVRVTKAPPWWDADQGAEIRGNIPDENIIYKILDLAIEAQRLYSEEIKKESVEAIAKLKNKLDILESAESDKE